MAECVESPTRLVEERPAGSVFMLREAGRQAGKPEASPSAGPRAPGEGPACPCPCSPGRSAFHIIFGLLLSAPGGPPQSTGPLTFYHEEAKGKGNSRPYCCSGATEPVAGTKGKSSYWYPFPLGTASYISLLETFLFLLE